MADPLLLYSTNTWLAHNIAREYYRDRHYVWCTPFFDNERATAGGLRLPPSSSPAEIYRTIFCDVELGDRHSAKLQSNRAGILRGAMLKRQEEVISDEQLAEILYIRRHAELVDFRPLIFLIPYDGVRRLVKPVPMPDRANPFSAEFIIESLPGSNFDTIHL